MFRYDPEMDLYTTFDVSCFPYSAVSQTRQLILVFGDVWFLDQHLKSSSISNCQKSISENKDTVFSLVVFYILNHLALDHAEDWYENSYASYLYPQTQMSSQRLSE